MPPQQQQVAPSTTQIQAHVRRLRQRLNVPGELAVGIRSAMRWSGEGSFTVDGRPYEIAWCTGPLEARQRLAEYDGAARGLVLVTPLDEHALGADVVARLARSRLETVRAWDLLLEQFQAHQLDPQVAAHRWIADALLSVAGDGPFEAVPAGVLDAQTVWKVLLARKLGVDRHPVDLEALLAWTQDAEGLSRYAGLDDEFRKGVRDYLLAACGATAGAVLDCVDAGHGQDAVPLGLACRVVFHESGGQEPAFPAGAVRLEKYTLDHPVTPGVGRLWAAAAEAVVRRLREARGVNAARPVLARGDQLLADLKAQSFAHFSDVLPDGFERRLSTYAAGLRAWLDSRSADDLDALAKAAYAVANHDQARLQADRVRRVEMSLRLARYLAGAPAAAAGSQPAPLEELAADYARDGGFVDWARGVLGGEGQAELADAYTRLAAAVTDLREQQNERFARSLVQWTASGASGPQAGLLPIESVLDAVVAPLAAQGPVLLVVIDGMSFAVFRELLEDLVGRQGWVQLAEPAYPGGRPVVSTVPSVTEFARTSLLSGKLSRGGQSEAASGFASHPALVAAGGRTHGPPMLFHKAELEAAGNDLSGELRKAIGSSRRAVAVVINAVDDHLLKGDQVQPRWTADYIRVLRPLLHEAASAGRWVVLASDHGHVIDRRAEGRESDRGERWRSASPGSPPPAAYELQVGGPRVVADGGRVTALWSERVHFGGKKNGYHGGLSPQEMLAPLAVLAAPSGRRPEGYGEVALYSPAWWDVREPAAPPPPAAQVAFAAPAVKAAHQPPTLFDLPKEGEPAAPAVQQKATPAAGSATAAAAATKPPAWIDGLLASPVFETQKKLAGRTPVPDAVVRSFLEALAARGGKVLRPAMARHLDLPPLRLPGVIAAMRRVLNLDGVDVLSVDEASDSVVLDVGRLKLQFDLK